MPRKSAASFDVIAVNGAAPWVVPPPGMSKDSRKVFVDIVAANSPQHFVQSDVHLLRAYAEQIVLAEQAGHAIEREGAVRKDGTVNPWCAVQARAVRTMAVLSARLRLNPQSRMTAKGAGREAANHRPLSVYDQMRLDEQ